MAIHLISYDLINPGQKYEKVHEAIKAASVGTYLEVLESTWIIDTRLTIDQVSEYVRSNGMDSGDHILVVDVTGDSRQGWLPQDRWNWINQNWY